jgi:hypothetical protein
MKSSSDYYVFDKWADAPAHAFGSKTKSSIVPPEDKEAYRRIIEELRASAEFAREVTAGGYHVRLKEMNYSPEYGSRGHRPVDLWISLCGEGSEAFGEKPQVYAIASQRGLEVGFAVSIDEADYHDPSVKARNRVIVPLLNAKLPAPTDALVKQLDSMLGAQGGWHFNGKTRLSPGMEGWDRYVSAAEMIASLKAAGATSGGGTICRVFQADELASIDLEVQFATALENFLPLIAICAPTRWDAQIAADQNTVEEFTESISFDPADVVDGRARVLAEVARRQGQATFRAGLLKAYEGKCAITGTAVPAVLEAAHITPYLGNQTNDITNGVLLRADLHTLLDMRLIRIDPVDMTVRVSESLKGTEYEAYEGRSLRLPLKVSQRPSVAAIRAHFDSVGYIHDGSKIAITQEAPADDLSS